jgi:hypothetical protein
VTEHALDLSRHTADIDEPCRTLFVTPGLGIEHRPR